MLFSIVVPIYKVEKYLNQCVDAILNQTFKDFEVILVDDGSPDNCPAICDDYALKDNRVKVVHKENGGLADARNAGVKNASGEYLIFKDSDDYWDDENALAKIKTIIDETSPDVVTWRRKKLFEDSGEISPVGYNIEYFGDSDVNKLFTSRSLDTSACMKAIKRVRFGNGELYFERGVLSEDIEWCARLLSIIDTIQVSNLDFYVYRKRYGSITNQIGERNIRDLKSHIEKIKHIVDNAQKNKKLLQIFLAEQFCNTVIAISRYKDRNVQISWIKQNKNLLKYGASRRSKLLNIVLKLAGVKISLKLIGKM